MDRYAQLCAWGEQKQNYLTTFVEVHSLADCLGQLSVFAGYEQENKTTQDTHVAELISLGDDIRSASHKSKYSTYEFDHTITNEPKFEAHDPEARTAVATREQTIRDKLVHLANLAVEYKKVLDDHKAREEYAEQARIAADVHRQKFEQLNAWIKDALLMWVNNKATHSKYLYLIVLL